MNNESTSDALFVINQDCDLEKLGCLIRKKNFQRVFVLTSHSLFANEREVLRKNSMQNPVVKSFADYLSDEEMADCDAIASEQLLADYARGVSRRAHNSRFMALSLARKNAIVREKALEVAKPPVIFYADGLGIDDATWHSAGGVRLTPPVFSRQSPTRYKFYVKLKREFDLLFRSRTFCLAEDNDVRYLFLTTVKRLRFTKAPVCFVYNPVRDFLGGNFHRSFVKRLDRYVSSLEKRLGHPLVIATTIHECADWMSQLKRPLHVFADGYRPGNYTRTNFDSYQADVYVTRTMFDSRWFEQFGGQTRRSPCFLQVEYFQEVPRVEQVKIIVLLLNHAGDWSALINRSDTDRLIEVFVDAARNMPEVKFIIRTHPTMTHPSHEGRHSLARIKRYVNWCALANLEISTGTLEEDLQRGDCLVSEYSQTLLDAYRQGRVGLIANCSHRRSFSADYEGLGFPRVNEGETLTERLRKLVDKPADHIASQNEAVLHYNEMLKQYLSS